MCINRTGAAVAMIKTKVALLWFISLMGKECTFRKMMHRYLMTASIIKMNLEAPKNDCNGCCTTAGVVECIMHNVTTSYYSKMFKNFLYYGNFLNLPMVIQFGHFCITIVLVFWTMELYDSKHVYVL